MPAALPRGESAATLYANVTTTRNALVALRAAVVTAQATLDAARIALQNGQTAYDLALAEHAYTQRP